MRHLFIAFTSLVFSVSLVAQPIGEHVREAMSSDIRSADEKARDIQRKPDQVLAFFGLEEDMRVIEIMPFGGWYTKILGPVLKEEGQLYTTQPDLGQYSAALDPTLELPGMDRVVKLDYNVRAKNSPDERMIGPGGDWDLEPVDMVLTFQNYHNLQRADRMALNQAAYNALKPGGVYGIVDHSRRHMQADEGFNRRRVDPVLVIEEVQTEGFVLDGYSDILYMSDDDLTLEVGQPQVSGKSDRFTLRFRKPE